MINRVVFTNCGISGEGLASLLKGLCHLKDLKSIVYKQNGFSHESVVALTPLLKREIPFHLEELRLIDLKITGSSLTELLESMSRKSLVRKLALVNLKMTELQFTQAIDFVKINKNLQ